VTKPESIELCRMGNEFIFSVNEEYDLDGNIPTNLARFINHSCAPNCEAHVEAGEVWMMALRDIQLGEEITFNYGYDLEDYRDHPCSCGGASCVGYIVGEQFFERLRGQRLAHSC
jgi:SET domain-containing protein